MSDYAPADIVRWLLVRSGQLGDPTVVDGNGLPTQAWPGYHSVEPSLPDNCVTLYDTDGTQDGRGMIDGYAYHHYGFMVRIRATDAPTGRATAKALHDYLSKGVYLAQVTVPSASGLPPATYTVHCISDIRTPIPVGQDTPKSKRFVHTINAFVALAIPY